MPSVWRRSANRIWHAHRSLEGAQKKVETYYYDIRKQVFEYDEVMNNQRRAVFERRGAGWSCPQETGDRLRQRTMGEIVEAYVNPDLPPEEWDLNQLVGKVKEFIYLLEDLRLIGSEVRGRTAFLQDNCGILTTSRKAKLNSNAGPDEEAERFFILQQIVRYGGTFAGHGCPAGIGGPAWLRSEGSPD